MFNIGDKVIYVSKVAGSYRLAHSIVQKVMPAHNHMDCILEDGTVHGASFCYPDTKEYRIAVIGMFQ